MNGATPSLGVVAPASSTGPINILIVDDEPKNLTVLETVLNEPDYRLIRAESADQALLALVADEFALLILDVRMPGMNGFQLAEVIKERKKTSQVPIIFLTAHYNEDQHVLDGYGAGAVDYLHKPLNPIVLRSKVAVFAELYRKNREVAMANRALLAEVAERRRAEEQLRELNETLDQRVMQRTEALNASQEELKQADLRKNEFLAMLAHELRNPLAPIQNAVQLLNVARAGAEGPTVNRVRGVIERQVHHLVRLVDDLLDISRITSGKIQLRKEPLDLVALVQQAVETSRPLIEARQCLLSLTLPRTSVSVDGDFTRLSQVLSNLLSNAAKFSDQGGKISLTVEKATRGDGAEQVVLRVADAGRGIDAVDLHHLFEIFYQANHGLGGLGVGLSLAKRLIEMHGGQVEARSAGRGQGSEFVVRLPLIEGSRPVATTVTVAPTPTVPRARILVVDDNRDSAETMAMLLESYGHEVLTVHDANSAIELALRVRPTAVLMDIGMPVMDGYEACRAMRSGGLTQAFIVAVTGYGRAEDRRRSQEAGFDAHEIKPVDGQAIRRLLAQLPAQR